MFFINSLFIKTTFIVLLFMFSGCLNPEIVELKNIENFKNNSDIKSIKNVKKINYTKYIPAKILDKSFYDKAFSVAQKKFENKNNKNINTNILLVNHHLLAPHFIADTLNQISKKQKSEIKNIILISPNHFHEGNFDIMTSNLPFKIAENNFVETQKNILDLPINNSVMSNEHGITGIVGFISKIFSKNNIKITPIIIKDKTTIEKAKNLAEKISKNFVKKDTIVIISMDMSHDLFPQIANFHDKTTLEAIKTLDENAISHIDTDSRPTLQIMFTLAKIWNQKNFTITHHSSSAKILQKKYQPDTTSYITGFFTKNNIKNLENKNNSKNTRSVTGLFLGDMMFDRYIRKQLDKDGWESILDWRMKRFMTGSDFTVVNFEGAMTNNKPYPARDDMMAFTSDPKWAKNMKEYGINIASLANNHSLNFGKQGFVDTKKFLEKYDISTFGTPYNKSEVENLSVIKKVRGIKIAFVAYHELFSGNTKPITEEIQNIKSEKLADFIVVYSHWGDEYLQKIHPRPQKKAHIFIDAGADIVIGHHPHVVQPMEIYKDKYIFYSLGNFVFDQVLGKSVRTRLGLGLEFVCKNNCKNKKINYTLFPLIADKNKIYNFKVELMQKENQEKFISWFDRISK